MSEATKAVDTEKLDAEKKGLLKKLLEAIKNLFKRSGGMATLQKQVEEAEDAIAYLNQVQIKNQDTIDQLAKLVTQVENVNPIDIDSVKLALSQIEELSTSEKTYTTLKDCILKEMEKSGVNTQTVLSSMQANLDAGYEANPVQLYSDNKGKMVMIIDTSLAPNVEDYACFEISLEGLGTGTPEFKVSPYPYPILPPSADSSSPIKDSLLRSLEQNNMSVVKWNAANKTILDAAVSQVVQNCSRGKNIITKREELDLQQRKAAIETPKEDEDFTYTPDTRTNTLVVKSKTTDEAYIFRDNGGRMTISTTKGTDGKEYPVGTLPLNGEDLFLDNKAQKVFGSDYVKNYVREKLGINLGASKKPDYVFRSLTAEAQQVAEGYKAELEKSLQAIDKSISCDLRKDTEDKKIRATSLLTLIDTKRCLLTSFDKQGRPNGTYFADIENGEYKGPRKIVNERGTSTIKGMDSELSAKIKPFEEMIAKTYAERQKEAENQAKQAKCENDHTDPKKTPKQSQMEH